MLTCDKLYTCSVPDSFTTILKRDVSDNKISAVFKINYYKLEVSSLLQRTSHAKITTYMVLVVFRKALLKLAIKTC